MKQLFDNELSRRAMLAQCGTGMGMLGLAGLLAQQGALAAYCAILPIRWLPRPPIFDREPNESSTCI